MPGKDETAVRVWLVERTFSDDEQNVIVHVYATPDGTRYYATEARRMRETHDPDDVIR